MGSGNLIKKIIIAAAIIAAVFFGLKFLWGSADSDLGDYDGNRGSYEQQVDNC